MSLRRQFGCVSPKAARRGGRCCFSFLLCFFFFFLFIIFAFSFSFLFINALSVFLFLFYFFFFIYVGGFGIKPSVFLKKIESGHAKGAGSKTPETVDSICTPQASHFGWHLSSPTKPSNESSMAQGVEVSFDSLFRDETSGANIAHSESLGLVFAQGVSSFLTLNLFELECCFRFR
jgi:hypothetical protein